MGETFFTSKDAAKITGCTLRQLQYWREKGVIVPMVSATGTGRSVYYSRSELVELAVMVYLLSVGLTNDYNISPSRYIHVAEAEEFRPISEILQELEELESQAEETNRILMQVLSKLR